MPDTKCSFVSIIGAPNVGKSTLTNVLSEAKLSIVTPKAQTTRGRLRAITIYNNTQIVFVDTPGIFKIKDGLDNKLNRSLILTAKNSFEGVDYLALVIDAKKGVRENDKYIIDLLKSQDNKKILILNKVDLIKKEKLFELSLQLNDMLEFDSTFMISALKNKGVEDILKFLDVNSPKSPWMYPEDQMTDSPLRLMVAEITREKIFMNLQEELPYNSYVETETFEENKNSVTINQAVYVKTESHKKILIGKSGSKIKKIGEVARNDMSKLIGKKVNLYLFVKVRENWMDNKEKYLDSSIDFDG